MEIKTAKDILKVQTMINDKRCIECFADFGTYSSLFMNGESIIIITFNCNNCGYETTIDLDIIMADR